MEKILDFTGGLGPRARAQSSKNTRGQNKLSERKKIEVHKIIFSKYGSIIK